MLGATSIASRLEWIFFVMGVVFAPAVGAMAGDWLRQRGRWAGARPGFHRAGVFAWGAGLATGVAGEVGRVSSPEVAPWWYSSAIERFRRIVRCVRAIVPRGTGTKRRAARPARDRPLSHELARPKSPGTNHPRL